MARNLIAAGRIAPGDVDERSITDVRADDLRGYTQCHFFAGIGGWSYALHLAGWPDDRPVWTGSCPCQPFSAAGKGAAFDDDHHFGLNGFLSSPSAALQSSLESRLKRRLDGVGSILFSLIWRAKATPAGWPYCQLAASARRTSDSDCGSWPTPMREDLASSGAAGYSTASGRHSGTTLTDAARAAWPTQLTGWANASGAGRGRDARTIPCEEREGESERGAVRCFPDELVASSSWRGADGIGDAGSTGLQEPRGDGGLSQRALGADARQATERASPWGDIEWLSCTDGKARPTKPAIQFMADGLPESLGRVRPSAIVAIEEEIDAKIGQACRGKAVLDLWYALAEETLRRPHGGLRSLQEAPVLLAFMCQLTEQGWPVPKGVPQSRQEASGALLRMLWDGQAASCASRQRGLDEQQSMESANALRVLSSVLAFHAQAAWAEAYAENARNAFPLAHRVPARVGKLRAAGNAIVPQVAAEFIAAVKAR